MYLLVNFGGPRSLEEIPIFLRMLLTDLDVIHPTTFKFLHHLLFTYIAQKRAKTIVKDYKEIGGRSPIFEETENLACALEKKLFSPVVTFHRYLPSTHQKTLSQIENASCENITVFPLFPQFTFATTGSCARFFSKKLSKNSLKKLSWIKSYPTHPAFVEMWRKNIEQFMENQGLKRNECYFLFTPHGLPQKYIVEGDPYEKECRATVEKIMRFFPEIPHVVGFQSQFGKLPWMQPGTGNLCKTVLQWHQGKKNILFIPISFTSDHIETLFEIEKVYMPMIKEAQLVPWRVPAINVLEGFADMVISIFRDFDFVTTSSLVRK